MLGLEEKTHSIRDYKLLPEGSPCQLIGGELIMVPAPNPRHQIILGNIVEKVRQFTKGLGITLFSPVDVYLGEEDAYQPDMIVEILSPSTAYYDIKKKFKVYERCGVKEYWIVDPEMKGVDVFLLKSNGEFELSSKYYEAGIVKSIILDGLEIDLKEIFQL